jgi:hypothetical protein
LRQPSFRREGDNLLRTSELIRRSAWLGVKGIIAAPSVAACITGNQSSVSAR